MENCSLKKQSYYLSANPYNGFCCCSFQFFFIAVVVIVVVAAVFLTFKVFLLPRAVYIMLKAVALHVKVSIYISLLKETVTDTDSIPILL